MTVLVLLLGVPFLIATFEGFLFMTEQNQLREKKSLARRSVNRLAKELGRGNPRSIIEERFSQSGLSELGTDATLVDRDGTILWQSSADAPASRSAKGVQIAPLPEGSLLYTMPERDSQPDLRRLVTTLSVLTSLGYGIGAWLLVGRTLKPISQVVAQAKALPRDGTTTLSPPTQDKELVELVRTLNEMFEELNRETEERIKSYASLSHELRTPIQSLLGNIDMALSEDRSKPELQQTLIDVQAQVQRLHTLSEAVLFLQGLSTTNPDRHGESIDLATMTQDVLGALAPLMELRGISVASSVEAQAPLTAPVEHIEILLRNLFENAVKHSPSGATIVLNLSSTPEGYVLTISNPTSPESASTGNRLGLRICEAVVRANHWTLETNRSEEEFSAKLTIPTNDSS